MSAVFERVRRAASTYPDMVAVSGSAGATTYAELVTAAQALADELRAAGVREGDVVGMALGRAHLPVGVLGIMASGAGYLPIDDAAPEERILGALDECAVRVLLADREGVTGGAGRTTVRYDDESLRRPHADRPPRPVAAAADELAYVIATSGTTRRPKLVAVGQRGLLAHATALHEKCRLAPGDRVLQFHTINFDAAAEEIYPTLVAGATVVTIDEVPAPHELIEIARRHRVTVLDLPTSYWHQLAAEPTADLVAGLAGVRVVIIGGEGAVGEVVERWLADVRIPLLNSYGVTEATITSTAVLLGKQQPGADVPIGWSIEGSTTRVLDEDLTPTPYGESGELCVGGVGVAWGYLGEPGLTADRFRPDPHAERPGARLYRTGDRCTADPDGLVHFMGRADLEVKIRGFRLDLSHVEAELLAIPGVVGAAVVPSQRREGQLVAHLVADLSSAPLSVDDVRGHLAQRLPATSLPHVFRFLPSFPLTSHGKVDRAALAAAEHPEPRKDPAAAPAAETPAGQVAAIWSEVLGVPDLAPDTNFFEAGGHSLLAFRILSKIRNRLGIDVPAKALFDAPLLGDFTRRVEAAATARNA